MRKDKQYPPYTGTGGPTRVVKSVAAGYWRGTLYYTLTYYQADGTRMLTHSSYEREDCARNLRQNQQIFPGLKVEGSWDGEWENLPDRET